MALYRQLDSEKREFRLVRFIGGSGQDNVWELSTFSLADPDLAPWTALSYTWGEKEARDSILLNGHTFQVRPILWSFLSQMESENQRGWFFIDAMCINQADITDRNAQVRLMGNIFRDAKEVIVWLRIEGLSREEEYAYTSFMNDLALCPVERRKIIGYLTCQPYWSRLWIVQEVLLARRFTIHFYSMTVDWLETSSHSSDIGEEFKMLMLRANDMAAFMVPRMGHRVPVHPRLARMMNRIACATLMNRRKEMNHDLKGSKLISFYDVVTSFSDCNCQHRHDSIFGLLGIADSYVLPDYNLSIAELYAMALCNCLLSLGYRPRDTTSATGRCECTFRDQGKLDDLGTVLYRALKLDPFHPVVFLISHEICGRFKQCQTQRMIRDLVVSWETIRDLDYSEKEACQKGRESEGDLSDQLEATSLSRMKEMEIKLAQDKLCDKTLSHPDQNGRAMRCSERVVRIQAICDDMFASERLRDGDEAGENN